MFQGFVPVVLFFCRAPLPCLESVYFLSVRSGPISGRFKTVGWVLAGNDMGPRHGTSTEGI